MNLHLLETRVPPPVLALTIGLLMWLAVRFWPLPEMPIPYRGPLALALALAGFAFTMAGIVPFRRARTTVNPLRPASASTLVTSGVYRVTRNPMYVGLLMVLLAWVVYLAVPWLLLGPLFFVLYMARFQIVPEERALAKLFGEAYLAYQRRVRRWL